MCCQGNKKSFKILIVLLLVSFLIFPCIGRAENFQSSIWFQDPEGWHFYKEKKEEVHEPEYEEFTSAEKKLFSEKMKKRGEELLSKALEEPTVENVYAYARHQKEMMERSQEFSEVWQLVVSLYPDLLDKDHPANPAFRIEEYALAKEKEDRAIERLSQKAGLFFIYSSGCHYCAVQAKEVKKFLSEHPYFSYKAVSTDSGVLPEFPDTEVDNGFSVRIGIQNVPAIVLYFPEKGGFLKVSEGLIDKSTIKRRLILYEKLYETEDLDKFLYTASY